MVQLTEEIIRLAPWHLDVQVNSEISTSVALDVETKDKVAFVSPRTTFIKQMTRFYPQGFEGKRFLDCACNCGGYSFWAKELGASECFGFDVRQHWIDQANFLLHHRAYPKDNISFQVCDLYDLPKLNLKPFDITMFKGVFYHLPDPVSGLKIAADLTRELIYIDTAARDNVPDGFLAVADESVDHLMSGVHHLSWFPTGPEVLKQILRWLGFVEFRLLFWNKSDSNNSRGNGRLGLLASRKKGLLIKNQSNSLIDPK